MSIEWHCLVRTDRPNAPDRLPAIEVNEHPLQTIVVGALSGTAQHQRRTPVRKLSSRSNSGPLQTSAEAVQQGCDPLSMFARQHNDDHELDPLSKMSEEYHTKSALVANAVPTKSSTTQSSADSSSALWNVKRAQILSRYTTSDRLTIVSSFLAGGEILKQTPATSIADKVRHRLEQLDDCDDGTVVHRMLDLTQQDYVHKIEQLNRELMQAWASDQRVRALKIAIQCAKMLSDTSVMQFYPSQFVLITDILDNFGTLVYNRLRAKATSPDADALPEHFTAEQVSAAAKETCENWFYKIASIRELLPRFYMEIAILRCYAFLVTDPYAMVLKRVTQIARGIGDPLIAAYARCYLCRVGLTVCPDRSYVLDNLEDFLFVYHTMFSGSVRAEFARQRLHIDGYVALYQPALDWIMQAVAADGSERMLDTVLKQCQDKKNNGLLLNSILTIFGPELIAAHALRFVGIIGNSSTEGISRPALFRALGASLNCCDPPADQLRAVYAATWTAFLTLTDPTDFVTGIVPWTRYIARHCDVPELNALLAELCARLTPGRVYEQHYGELQTIAEHVFGHGRHLDALLAGESFLQFVDLFEKDGVRQDVCKLLLDELRKRSPDGQPIDDPIVINALMHVCRQLSDAVSQMTVDDERRQIGQLIGAFVRRATYGPNVEQQLSFYVDARATFAGLDDVFVTLVQCVNRLSTQALRLRSVGGRPTRESSAFGRVCAAYCFITVPSIASASARLDLYLLSGQVALRNACLGQADACFEAALRLIDELPASAVGDTGASDAYLSGYLCAFLGTLLTVPDSPSRGVLFLPRRLLLCVDRRAWDSPAGASSVYLAALDMLAAAAQSTYPYRVPGVVANDELYGGDRKFLAELDALASLVVGQLLGRLQALAEAQQLRAQATLALDLFGRVVWASDLGAHPHLVALALNLWTLAMKRRTLLDGGAVARLLQRVERLAERTADGDRRRSLEALTARMKQRL